MCIYIQGDSGARGDKGAKGEMVVLNVKLGQHLLFIVCRVIKVLLALKDARYRITIYRKV